MMCKVLAVHVDIRRGIGSTNLQVIPIGLGKLLLLNRLHVTAGSPVVVSAAVLTVDRVPGMRKIDKIPKLRDFNGGLCNALCEGPFSVQIYNRSQ